MSGGRWVRENNGDYQHYTDEEYHEKERSEGVFTALCMVIIGAIVMYVTFTDEEFVFGDFSNVQFLIFCGSALALLLGVIILKATSSISEIVGYLVLYGTIAGVIVYVFNCSGTKDSKKETKTEKISKAPNKANTLANIVSYKVENKS